jgi:hypothetical protein
MISSILQSTLSGIITNTFFAIGDQEIVVPFCVHKEQESPLRLKEGIIGYEYQCEVAIIDDTPDAIETYKESIIAAFEALIGTTVSGTRIDQVDYITDSPDFDTDSKLYTNILTFVIETRNR